MPIARRAGGGSVTIRALVEQFSGATRQLPQMLAAATYSISGTITDGGAPLAGVTVTTGAVSDTTDGSGAYTLAGLANGTYTVTPSLSGYTFTPASRSVTVSGANVTAQDFAAAAVVAPTVTPRTPLPVQLVHLTIGGTTYYFSTGAYSDAGRRFYSSRLLDWVSWERAVGCRLWDRSSRSGVGAIELANADGSLSDLLDADADGALVQVYECLDTDPIESAVKVAAGRVVSIDAEDRRVVRIVLQDPLAALDVPLQTTLYASGDAVDDSLIGTPKPVSIGAPLSVPLTLRDFGDQIYDVHDRRADLIPAGMLVRDGGAEVLWSLAAAPYAGVQLDARAVGVLVADVATGAGTETEVIGASLGDFATDLTGWTIDADGGSVTWESPGQARIVGTDAQQPGLSAGTVNAGEPYSWQVQVVDLTEGALELLAGGELVALLDTEGTHEGDFVAGADGPLTIRAAAGTGGIGETPRPAATDAAIDSVRLTRVVYGGTAADALQVVAQRAGLEPGQLSISSLVALRAARPWQIAYYAGQPVQARDVVREILDTVLGWAYSLPDGRIAVGLLQPPDTGTIRGRILRTQWQSGPVVERDRAPGVVKTVAGRRNWRPYSPSELVDDPAIDSIRAALTAEYRTRKTAGAVSAELGARETGEIDTLLSDAADVQELADLLPDLYPPTAKPRFVTGELHRSLTAGWLPGDRITVEIPSGPTFDCRLIGVSVSRQRARVTLWGWA